MSYRLDQKLAVEFIGMFLFVFTVGMATEAANPRVPPWPRSRSALS